MGKRNDPKRRAEVAAAAERRAKVWQYRLAGASLGAIATAVGVSSKTVYFDLRRILAELAPAEADVATYRKLEGERLDAVRLRLSQRLAMEAERPGGGDASAVAALARALVSVSESQRRLIGADKPVQIEVAQVSPSELFGQEALDAMLVAGLARKDEAARAALLERAGVARPIAHLTAGSLAGEVLDAIEPKLREEAKARQAAAGPKEGKGRKSGSENFSEAVGEVLDAEVVPEPMQPEPPPAVLEPVRDGAE